MAEIERITMDFLGVSPSGKAYFFRTAEGKKKSIAKSLVENEDEVEATEVGDGVEVALPYWLCEREGLI